jgi:rod shape-determining protein MreC
VARKRALRRRAIAALLLVLSVAMLTLYFRETAGGAVHRVQETSLTVISPLQRGAARAIKPFRDAWHWVGDLFHAKSENADLKQEIAKLQLDDARYLTIQQENDQLRALLAIKRDHIFANGTNDGLRLIPARVIARSTNVWYSTVTIDVGRSAGIAVYDAVVNGEGLVGRVTAVTDNACQVTLITDQQSFVDAMVLPGGGQGLVAGSVTGDLTLQYVDKSQVVKVGQDVVTSGMRDSIFVPGIPIGVVTGVAQQDVELYQSISIRPLVDFHKLDFVMVVHK